MLCGDQSLIKVSEAAIQVKPLPCGCWGCCTCGPRKRARFEMMVEAGKPSAMTTFTLRRRDGRSALAARKTLGQGIPEVFRRFRRLTGIKVAYWVGIEAHKSGMPHAHVATRDVKKRDQAVLKRLWHQVTGDSFEVQVQPMPAAAIKRYLGKYMAKDLVRFGTSKRHWGTRDYLPPGWGEPTEEQLVAWRGWERRRQSPEQIISSHRRRGWNVQVTGRGEATMTRPRPWNAEQPRPQPRPPPTAPRQPTMAEWSQATPPQRAVMMRLLEFDRAQERRAARA